MASHRSVVLLGMGARTSLGASPAAVGAAYQAGISRHRHHPSLLTRAHAPFVVAADPHLPAEVPASRRIREMVKHAATQALTPLASAAQIPVDLLVAVPEVRPGLGPDVPERALDALRGCLAERTRLGQGMSIAGGRSAGLRALEIALENITTGRSAACLWCGVDSYLAPPTLDWLEGSGLLHAAGARWGFIPGEAASACLLVASDVAERMGCAPLAILRAAATAVEQRPPEQSDVALGHALTTATRVVLEALPQAQRVHRIYADLNGERERVDEAGFTLARIADRAASHPCLVTPADRLGEVGAASAPLFAVLAVTAAQRGRAPGPNILLWTMGPGALRGAALLSVPVAAREG